MDLSEKIELYIRYARSFFDQNSDIKQIFTIRRYFSK